MQENGILGALNFKFSWGSMPPNPPSLVGANHSCQILDPPLFSSFPTTLPGPQAWPEVLKLGML